MTRLLQQKSAERNILDMEDFQVKDVLGEKSLIVIGSNSPSSSEDDYCGDGVDSKAPLSLNHLIIKLDYVSNALPSYPPDYTVNWFPQKEKEEESAPVPHVSHPEGTAAAFHELMANADSSGCFYQMTCDADYVVNSSFVGRADVETQSGRPPK